MGRKKKDTLTKDMFTTEGDKASSSMDEQAWETESKKDKAPLVDKSAFTKAVAEAWNEHSRSTKFENFHPNWQRVMLRFARDVQGIPK